MYLQIIIQLVLSAVASALGCDVMMGMPVGVPGVEGKGVHVGGAFEKAKSDTLEREFGNDGEGDDYKPNSLEDGVLKLRRGNYIIDTITRMGKVDNVKSMVHEYYTVDQKPRTLKLASNIAASGNPVRNYQQYTFTVDNVDLIDKYSVLLVSSATTGVYGYASDGTVAVSTRGVSELALQVVDVNANGTVTVVPLNGQKTNGNYVIPAAMVALLVTNTVLFNIGLAMPETSIKSAPVSVLPVSFTNYMQKFMSTTLQTTISKETVNRAGWTPSDDDEYAVEEFKKDIEFSYIWGKKGKRYDTGESCNVWTTSGIIEQWIEKGGTPIEIDMDNVTEEFINNTIEEVFVGNNGADRRILLAGPGFATAIANCEGVNRQIDANGTEVIFGRTWKKWVSVHGELDMTVFPAFSERGQDEPFWKNCALILDPQFISKKVLRSIERLSLDLRGSGDMDADSNVLMEISCVILKNAKAHALIVPKP